MCSNTGLNYFFALSAAFRDLIVVHSELVTSLTESHALLYLYVVILIVVSRLAALGLQGNFVRYADSQDLA